MNLFPKANQLQPYKALHREIIVYFPKKHYTCNYKTIYITANQQQYDMKNKKRLKMLLFSLAILFTGCDYWCQDEYHVLNNTDDTLQIIVNYDTLRLYGSWQTGENMDSRLNDTTHVVNTINRTITGLKKTTFNSGENGSSISMLIPLSWNSLTGSRKNGHSNPNED